MTDFERGLRREGGWEEVRTDEDVERLLSRTRDFHDAFVRVMHVETGAYVNSRFELCDIRPGSLWVLIQTQWNDVPAVELFLAELRGFEYDHSLDRKGSLTLEAEEHKLVFGAWSFKAEKLYYRLGGAGDLGLYPKIMRERILPELRYCQVLWIGFPNFPAETRPIQAHQAAVFSSCGLVSRSTRTPSTNVAPSRTRGSKAAPLRRRQRFCAISSNLKAMVMPLLRDPGPFVTR